MKTINFVCALFLSQFFFSQTASNLDVLSYEIRIELTDQSNRIDVYEEISFVLTDNSGVVSFDLDAKNADGTGMQLIECSSKGNEKIVFELKNDKLVIAGLSKTQDAEHMITINCILPKLRQISSLRSSCPCVVDNLSRKRYGFSRLRIQEYHSLLVPSFLRFLGFSEFSSRYRKNRDQHWGS